MESEASRSAPPPVRPLPTAARPRATKRLKRWLRYHLVRATLAGLSLLPLGAAQRLGEALGTLGFHLARGERRKALEGLSRAFPERTAAEREALARDCFRHLGRMALELAVIDRRSDRLEGLVAWSGENRARFAAASARGRGVIFVTGHLGSWELLARRIMAAGFPGATIAREASDARMTALLQDFRARGGLETIWRGDPGAARAMLRTLRSGHALGLLIDQDTRVQSVFVPFFGHLAATPRAAADLALRTGAALLVGSCLRQADGTYLLEVEEVPLPSPGREAREEAVLEVTATLTAALEREIRRAPAQWVWMHPRWKTRPPTGT